MKSELEQNQAIRLLMAEHQIILRTLEELREIVERVELGSAFSDITDQLKNLAEISRLLLETESHHKREEDAIFPRLENHSVIGPPEMMRLEHNELRARKKHLAELVTSADRMTYEKFSRELSEVGRYITDNLEEHIYKEDNVLYPVALEVLLPDEWDEVNKEFDRIGYCPFTPQVNQ